MKDHEDISDDEEPDDEETGNSIDKHDDNSLDMFAFSIIRRLNRTIKIMFISSFLDALGAKDRRDPFEMGSRGVCIELSGECKSNISNLVENADIIFFRTLNKKQKELYNLFTLIKFFLKFDLTGERYIDLLNSCNKLSRITGLPFALEDKYGGLKDWDTWNKATEKALKEGRKKFGRRRKKK